MNESGKSEAKAAEGTTLLELSNDGRPGSVDDPKCLELDIETITRDANLTIVIHPGSSQLRIGRAWDRQPVIIPHAIAWRHRRPRVQPARRMPLFKRQGSPNIDAEALAAATDYIVSRQQQQHGGGDAAVKPSGVDWKRVLAANESNRAEQLDEGCGWTWTDASSCPDFFVGDDALYIEESECYDLFWPIVNGKLNTAEKSLTAVLADLEALWTKVIETFLHIRKSEISKYRCILLIPDIYNRLHVKHLINLLLIQMGFSSIIVHQESVCAAYGCGVATACVVDVGHHKTAICCVEDGLSHEATRITMDVGGNDITRVFSSLLQRNGFPYKNCNTEERMDALLLEELKETFCHLTLTRAGIEAQEFHLRRPGQMSLLYPICLGDETMQAVLSLFYPEMHGINNEKSIVHLAAANPGDTEDPHDELFLVSTRPKHQGERRVASTSATGDSSESLCADEPPRQSSCATMTKVAEDKLIGIDEAVVWSVRNCPDSYESELKRRMLNCVLLVGGGLANFAGADDVLRERVIAQMMSKSGLDPALCGHVNVVTRPKGLDSSNVVWKGGSVLSCLENGQELWIHREEWMRHGVRILRKRCAFVW